MQLFKCFGCVMIAYIFSFYLLLPPFVLCSSTEELSHYTYLESKETMQPKLNHQTTSYITLHGILLWVSMGFLMPLGILTIRMSSNVQENGRKFRFFFYLHTLFQILAVVLATVGAVMSIRTLDNSFNNSHQRLGLGIFAAMWVQFLIGVFKPSRGSNRRSKWYILHWILGTTVSLVGIINIYTGLRAYQDKTSKSTRLWTIIFTAQVSCFGFLYLLQDKFEHLRKQRLNSENDTRNNVSPGRQIQVVTSKDQIRNDQKVLVPEACGKSNALVNLFE